MFKLFTLPDNWAVALVGSGSSCLIKVSRGTFCPLNLSGKKVKEISFRSSQIGSVCVWVSVNGICRLLRACAVSMHI